MIMYQHNRLSICDVGQIEFVYVCLDLVSWFNPILGDKDKHPFRLGLDSGKPRVCIFLVGNFKIGSQALFTHLKIISLQYFQFSKINGIQINS